MLTPKEKAAQLAQTFLALVDGTQHNKKALAKGMAAASVHELINTGCLTYGGGNENPAPDQVYYWQEVINELKLYEGFI